MLHSKTVQRNEEITNKYDVKDKVLVRRFNQKFGETKYDGPFVITKILGKNAYEMENNKKVIQRNEYHLKPFYEMNKSIPIESVTISKTKTFWI